MLGAMLGAHTDCLCTPESQFKADVIRGFYNEGIKSIDVAEALHRIKSHWRFRIWGLSLDDPPWKEVTSCRELITWIVKEYGQQACKPNARIWIDHTPGNRKHTDILFDLFPESKMIHIIRDGRAVASSIMHLDWGANTIERAAHFWKKRVLQGLEAESLWSNRVLRISYEDLVAKPEATLKMLCTFIGIEYQSQMVEGTGFRMPSYTQGQHQLVGKMPDIKRTNAWEQLLSNRQIEIFESIAGDLIEELGYSLKYGSGAKTITQREHFLLDAENFFRKIINRYRKKSRKRKIDLL
jgi:hypothetical protein